MLSYISFYFFLFHTYFLTRHFLGHLKTWNGFSDNFGFFPTLSHLHVHGEGKNVFIIINVAVFALYWPKVLAASAGRVERVRGGIPIQGPGLATTDNEWSGFWVLIRGIVDNEEAATQARGPVAGPPLAHTFQLYPVSRYVRNAGTFIHYGLR